MEHTNPCFPWYSTQNLHISAQSQYKDHLYRYWIIMLKIRRSWDRLIFNMGIPILVRQYLYIEMGLWTLFRYEDCHSKYRHSPNNDNLNRVSGKLFSGKRLSLYLVGPKDPNFMFFAHNHENINLLSIHLGISRSHDSLCIISLDNWDVIVKVIAYVQNKRTRTRHETWNYLSFLFFLP